MTKAVEAPKRWPGITMETLWLVAVLATVFSGVVGQQVHPHDLWWHIRAGHDIVAARSLSTVETLSYTVGGQPLESWAAYWLAEILMYGAYSVGGLDLLVALQGALITVACSLMASICLRRARSGRIAAGCVLFAALLGAAAWGVRPQALAYPLMTALMYAIDAYRDKSQRAWLLVPPLCVLLWVNCHPTFPVGIAWIGLWLLDELWIALKARSTSPPPQRHVHVLAAAATLTASCAAVLANPRCFGIFTYLSSTTSNAVVRSMTAEWQPPTFETLSGALFLAGLLLTAALLAVSQRRPSVGEVGSLLVFGALGLQTERGGSWFGMALTPVLALSLPWLTRTPREAQTEDSAAGAVPLSRRARWLNGALALLFVGLALARLPWWRASIPGLAGTVGPVPEEHALAATEVLRAERLPAPLFSDQSFANYLTWAAPEYQVFYYARVGDPTVARDYLWIAGARCGWEDKLDEYGVNSLMLSVRDQPALIEALRATDGWEELYADPYAVLFVRRDRLS